MAVTTLCRGKILKMQEEFLTAAKYYTMVLVLLCNDVIIKKTTHRNKILSRRGEIFHNRALKILPRRYKYLTAERYSTIFSHRDWFCIFFATRRNSLISVTFSPRLKLSIVVAIETYRVEKIVAAAKAIYCRQVIAIGICG